MIARADQLPVDLGAAILAEARAGDEAAFAQIVARFHTDLLRIALVVSGDVDVATEAAQAAWVVAWRRLGDLREPSSLRPWLMSIAANEARQQIRSRGRRKVREVAVVDEGTPSADASIVERIDLGNALATLDPRDRELLALRYLAGLDSAEIGRAVGMRATAVRVRLTRARERLRQELGDA